MADNTSWSYTLQYSRSLAHFREWLKSNSASFSFDTWIVSILSSLSPYLFSTHQKWKKNWFVLYPASQNGIARLEFFDSPSGGGGSAGSLVSGSNEKTRKLDKKIIRLSECISILPALTESCPKDNMAAFCVETNDKTHVFAAEKNNAKDWMDTMCDIAFQVFLPFCSHLLLKTGWPVHSFGC